jgi:hypothetical protein
VLAIQNGYAFRTVCSRRFGRVFMVYAGRGAATREDARGFRRRHRREQPRRNLQSKYPNVCVALLGEDENAFAIVERVQRVMREAGVPAAEVKAFTVEACSGDYYHLLETVLRTVETT